MKRGLGFISLLGALFAGVHLTNGPRLESGRSAVPPLMAAPLQEPGPVAETCEAFESPSGGLSRDASAQDSLDKGEITALVQRFLGRQAAGQLPPAILPGDLRIAIATVPDPVHTHLSLQFDRTLEAIQQAAQDQGYTYDSSWLPWTMRGAEYSSYSDVNTEARETVARERCPGIILFRRNMLPGNCRSDQAGGPARSEDPYGCGMVVLVVGEEPTAGLNILEWNNALGWIEQYAKKDRTDKALRILGPVFSGSIPSFVRALHDVDSSSTSFTSILLYSGRIRGCASWRWLQVMFSKQAQPAFKLPLRSADFEENDALQIDHFYRYLEDRGHRISEVAILSEDETAYGGLPDAKPPVAQSPDPKHPTPPSQVPTTKNQPDEPLPCVTRQGETDLDNRPVHLYYPRDISAIRSAYQEQSIFSSESGSTSASTPQAVLRPEPSHSTGRHSDTIEPLSGQNLALTQEAQLYGIVSMCKTHGIRYIVLRSTNDLDYLFLARFFHRAYPAAYLVTTGTDMLFGREIDSTEFRGVLALSNYPLMPRGQDWTLQTNNVPQHAHRVFGSYTMEGTYLATRFLIRDPAPDPNQKKDELQPYTHPGSPDLPDYAPPFWDSTVKDGTPSIWLGVVGRGGYWPLALLDQPSSSTHATSFSNLAIISGTDRKEPSKSKMWQISLSAPWRFGCLLTLVAVALHLFAVWRGWDHQDLGVFVQFTPLRGSRGHVLMAVGGVIVCSIPFLMFFAACRMYQWLGPLDRLWTWLMGVAAMAACVGSVLAIGMWRKKGADAQAEIQASPGGIGDGTPEGTSHWIYPVCVLMILILVAAFCVWMWLIFGYGPSNPDGVAIAYRSVNLGSGVSPLVSLVLLFLGLYWWFWQTLCGLALLGDGRPVLPANANPPDGLSRVSDGMARNIEDVAIPFPNANGSSVWLYLVPLFVIVLQIAVMQRDWSQKFDLVLHSLENTPFNWMLHLLFWTSLYLLSLECVQLLMTWFSLKRLLVALNRLPLRRTFAALQGLSMRSLWSLSGTSSRARYNVFSHQLESLLHLRNELESFDSRTVGDQAIRDELEEAWKAGFGFVKSRCEKLDLAMLNDAEAYWIRERLSRATGKIIPSLLVKGWTAERTSLDLNEAAEEGKREERLPMSEDAVVRHAEEFVCMVYIGYLQNMLARMRTMVLSIAGIFAAIALSVAFYPYTPRPTIALALMVLLLGIGVVVSHVCAGLDRDSTLSHITNTEPGALGGHFWLRIISFLGVPALGLVVAQFPEITDLVSSWIQPSLNAMK
jgi:hypothetical protein